MKKQKIILSLEEVKHIAKLANLTLSESMAEKLMGQLSEVIEYINHLKKVETDNIEPTSQVTGLENVFREDEETPSLKMKEGFFKTKKII